MQHKREGDPSGALMVSRPVKPIRDAIIIAGGYAVSAFLWILFAETILESELGITAAQARAVSVDYAPFFLLSTLILFGVANRYLARLQESEQHFVEAQAQLRHKELAVRQGYVDVLDAVTGGKLILITEDEVAPILGSCILAERPLSDPKDLSNARSVIAQCVANLPVPDMDSFILAVSEALTNAVKHGCRAEYSVCRHKGCLQVVVRDHGPGIDFRSLPKATLIQGFSTTNTMGLGFTIMLEVCDRVMLTTDASGTVVVLELELETPVPQEPERSLETMLASQ